jgi:hypothetical protein
MSSSGQIQAIRYSEQKYSTDVIRSGHQYIRGHKAASQSINKLREIRRDKNAVRS